MDEALVAATADVAAEAASVDTAIVHEEAVRIMLAECITQGDKVRADLNTVLSTIDNYIASIVSLDSKCTMRLGQNWRDATDEDLHSGTIAKPVRTLARELSTLVDFMHGAAYLWPIAPASDFAEVIGAEDADKYTSAVLAHAKYENAYHNARALGPYKVLVKLQLHMWGVALVNGYSISYSLPYRCSAKMFFLFQFCNVRPGISRCSSHAIHNRA